LSPYARSFRLLIHFAAVVLPNNLRRLHRSLSNALPIHSVHKSKKLGMIELDAMMTNPGPAELGFLQPLVPHLRMQPRPAQVSS